MDKRRFLQWGVLFLLGIFVLGAAIPAMADSNNAQAGTIGGMLNRGKAWAAGMAYKGGAQNMVKAVADLTGLDVSTIIQERQAGKSLAAIAQEKGVTEEALINKIMTDKQAKLQSLVDSGKMTQDQYDTCVSQMQTRVKENLESTDTGKSNGQVNKMGDGGGRPNMLQAVADLTGLDVNTIMQERQAGKSLAAIAQEKGVTEEALINKIMTDKQAKLQSLVDSGKMTQAQYDTCVSQMQTRVKESLERTDIGRGNKQGQEAGQGKGYGRGSGLRNKADSTPSQ